MNGMGLSQVEVTRPKNWYESITLSIYKLGQEGYLEIESAEIELSHALAAQFKGIVESLHDAYIVSPKRRVVKLGVEVNGTINSCKECAKR